MNDLRPNEEKKLTVRANDFRYIPADYFNAALSEDGVKLILGVEEVTGEATELVGVQLTLRSANGLMSLLKNALEHAKDELGFEPEEPEFVDRRD